MGNLPPRCLFGRWPGPIGPAPAETLKLNFVATRSQERAVELDAILRSEIACRNDLQCAQTTGAALNSGSSQWLAHGMLRSHLWQARRMSRESRSHDRDSRSMSSRL